MDVLEGAQATIRRHLPIIVVERLKVDVNALVAVLDSYGYRHFIGPMNVLAIHPNDGTLTHVSGPPGAAST